MYYTKTMHPEYSGCTVLRQPLSAIVRLFVTDCVSMNRLSVAAAGLFLMGTSKSIFCYRYNIY